MTAVANKPNSSVMRGQIQARHNFRSTDELLLQVHMRTCERLVSIEMDEEPIGICKLPLPDRGDAQEHSSDTYCPYS